MKLPPVVRLSPLCGAMLLASLGLGTAAMIASPADAAPKRCRGNKKWYAGACRYPDEIAKIQAQLKRKKEQERELAEEALRRSDNLQELDWNRCKQATEATTISAWEVYLEEFPEGLCSALGHERIGEMQKDAARCAQAKRANTAAAWEAYLAEYPIGQCQTTARLLLEQMKEQHLRAQTAATEPSSDASTAPPEPETGQTAEAAAITPLQIGGWSAVGVGGAAMLGGGATMAYAVIEKDEAALMPGGVLLGAGTALVTTGVVLLLVGEDEPDETARRLPVLAPWFAPSMGGTSASWSF